ncbi:MAG: MFS transporter [Anaerolineae bacterium]
MTRNRFLPLRLFAPELVHNRGLVTASLGHLSIDLFAGMMPLVLLLQKDALALSYADVGAISMTFSLAGSFTQPFFGWLGDRWGHGRLIVLGVAIASLSMTTMLVADRFLFLILLALIGGLASGAFHPQGAALASHAPAGLRGSAVSLFMLGGNLGYSFGPLVATTALALAGAYMPALLMALGLTLSLLVYWLGHKGLGDHLPHVAAVGAAPARAVLSLALTVMFVVFFRSWIQSAVSTYIPQFVKAHGASTELAGNLLFAILFPLAIGGLIGGTLSDRVGRKHVLVLSTALIGPALWGLLHTDGLLPFAFGALLGLASGASVPVSIIMTQDLVPHGKGFMSGVAMGLQFVSGAIGVWVTGNAADRFGLDPTLSFSVLVPLTAAALALLLPADRRAKPAHEPARAPAEVISE